MSKRRFFTVADPHEPNLFHVYERLPPKPMPQEPTAEQRARIDLSLRTTGLRQYAGAAHRARAETIDS